MFGNKISRFKAQFGYVDNDLFSVRYEKVRGALIEVKKAWEYLKASGPPGLGDSFSSRFLELENAMANAKESVDSNSGSNSVRKEAYKTLDDVKKKSRALAEEISLVAKKTPTKITHDDGTTADVFPPDIPGFINMTPEEREKVAKQVGEKISSGKKKVNEIISGDYNGYPPPDRKAVSDIMWFLKTTAESKTGEPYERGALTLPDPGNGLRKFFDRVGEVYTRDSSHLKNHQNESGGLARGIDFLDGVSDKGAITDIDNLLPSGMRTVLLQQVDTPKGESRLYVKMETESARWNPFHGILGKQSDAPESRPLQKGDRWNSILHLGNLIKSKVGVSQGDDPTLLDFREKVPGSVTTAWKFVLKSAKDSAAAKSKLKSAKYISQMSEAILAVYALDIDDDDFWENFEVAAAAWQETVMEELPKKTVQDIEELFDRFGGEIVLGTNDLTTPPVAPTAPNNFSFYRQGNDGLCAYYSLCHFQNTDIGKNDFLQKAAAYYKRVLKISDEDALEFAQRGNDPQLLIEVFGLESVALATKDLHILAHVGRGHFTTVRKVNGSWWSYDSLKFAPVFIGDEDTLRGVAGGSLVYG